jgi:hypothetical protein
MPVHGGLGRRSKRSIDVRRQVSVRVLQRS